jgi:hypothetical protein
VPPDLLETNASEVKPASAPPDLLETNASEVKPASVPSLVAAVAKEPQAAKKQGPAQRRILEAAKELWPPDGVVPPDIGPAGLRDAVEDLYKCKAEARKGKSLTLPTWGSYKRFLEIQRGA